jgi:LysM repeat protein
MTRSSSAGVLALAVAMGWVCPASGQNAQVMIPMMMVPVTVVPVIMVQPVMAVPVVMVQPVVMMQPVTVQPVAAVPVVAAAPPAEPEGNMLSRLIAKIEVKTDNEIRNGPEGPMDQVNYRPPPEPPQMVAVPVVMVPAGLTAQGVYTVRSGGSLAAVAVRTGATLDALIALNPSLPSNRRLEAGTMVNLPFPWPQQ